mmetsp:Transcript_15661/g.24369  ORF Transcript_15661/g.24369 Transcript_15661/m.24369 type:complete len:224 (-) Transcript_15661:199-870(-)|eukprot:CAMPEP_0196803254 /NCGR_PEP_ID=MMETSP1362-20130617/2617_1 /TAXON_ID=163516 /ORGANISM="Leptocylindrus danicus, Strain CCMP1856" /LENGTH=223 /DNA_ID=CAMNT_0042174711 /DNA_START=37 /DNA_END=708 /DNA_ORIENTATION=+
MKSITLILVLVINQASAFPTNSFGVRSLRPNTCVFMAEEVDEIALEIEERMQKSCDSVVRNLQTISTGRANPAMLDRIQADYYGAPTPINQMASISVPSASQLQIDPYDKSSLGDIEKAIIMSDLGMTPQNDGSVIRINIPALTEERRKELLKKCKGIGEEGKVALRNVRRDGVDKIKKLEKASTIGEDQSKEGQDDIQKMTDKYVKNVDEIVAKKEKDVSKV